MTSVADIRSRSVFADKRMDVWAWRYSAELVVGSLAGGIPTDQRVIDSWMKTKITDSDEAIRQAVAETMVELSISEEEAVKRVGSARHFTQFKGDEKGIYIEGRQLKAAIKEAFMVAVGSGLIELRGWGKTAKFAKGFVAEHVMVVGDKLYIYNEAGEHVQANDTKVGQQFVHSQYGSAPHYKSYVENAHVPFTLEADWDFTEVWPIVWTVGEMQGVGASRSGGFGTYALTKWDQVGNVSAQRASMCSKQPVKKGAKAAKGADAADSEE